jgi:predicted SAM-dependent methyltransferase
MGCGKTYHPDWDNFDLTPADDSIRPLDLLKEFPFKDGTYEFCYSSHVLEHMPRSYAPRFLKEIYRILRPGGVIRIVVPDLEGSVRRYLQELDSVISGDHSALPRHQWMTIELLDQLTRTFSGGFMGRLWNSRPLSARGLIEERLGSEAGKWLRKFDGAFSRGEQAPLLPELVFDVQQYSPEQELRFREQGEIHRWMYDRISLAALLQEAGFRNTRVCAATESSITEFSLYHLDTDESGVIRKPDSLFMEALR